MRNYDGWWYNSKIRRKLIDIKYWFLYRTFERFDIVKLNLKPGYYDTDHRMEHAVFELFTQFIDKEIENGLAGFIDAHLEDKKQLAEYDAGLKKDEHGESEYFRRRIPVHKQMIELYAWIKDVYPFIDENEPDIDDAIPNKWSAVTPEEHEEIKKWVSKYTEYTKKMRQETDDKLIAVIKLREYYWT